MGLSARLLVPGDEERVDGFLKPLTPYAFFIRSNLARMGLVFEGKAHQAEYFGAFDGETLTGVLMHGWMGNVQVYAPDLPACEALVRAWKERLAAAPRKVNILLGPEGSIGNVLVSMKLDADALRKGMACQHLYALELDKLVIPQTLTRPGVLCRRAGDGDFRMLTDWRHDFFVETLSAVPGEATRNLASNEISRRLEEGELFILEDLGEPVCFCGIGGFLKDWTNVGPVWTPVDKRNRGYGRAALAGALLALRDEGMANAVLFTGRPDAQRACAAVGFLRIGNWIFDFLKAPVDRL
ncbi:MAG: hypothetical protein PHE27_01890 [Alphaproteobacteria bacterium]|nr:hypothetical protein [Alphaproteobacteria bacterium]